MGYDIGWTGVAALCVVLGVGCGPTEHTCAHDGQVIPDITRCYTIAFHRTEEPVHFMRFDEVEYAIMDLKSMSAQQQVPIADIALAYQDRLYCSVAHATPALENKNREVQQRVQERQRRNRADSLVLDSIRRGLIK